MKNNNIWNYPGYKYWNFYKLIDGSMKESYFMIKLKPAFVNKFREPLRFFYSGPLAWNRELDSDWLPYFKYSKGNTMVRIHNKATFSSNQPMTYIGVIIQIPAEIEFNPQDYIDVEYYYDNQQGGFQAEVSDAIKIPYNIANLWTPDELLNRKFG